MMRPPQISPLFPHTPLSRSARGWQRGELTRHTGTTHKDKWQILCHSGEAGRDGPPRSNRARSEEHTSELQSLAYLVCRLLLEKKKKDIYRQTTTKRPVPTHR